MRALAALLAWLVLVLPAAAQDYVVTHGRLTDEDFYRLVACGAAPGGDCTMPFVRWPRGQARNLRVHLEPPPPAYPEVMAQQMSKALDRAVREINDVGAALNLRRVGKEEEFDIVVRMLNVGEGEAVSNSGVSDLDGEIMGAAFVYVWWNGQREITDAVILMADDLPADEVYPVLLEELSQSLGFLNDIRNQIYERESVFSEDSNAVTSLGPQDSAAMLRHYPPLR